MDCCYESCVFVVEEDWYAVCCLYGQSEPSAVCPDGIGVGVSLGCVGVFYVGCVGLAWQGERIA